MGQSLSLNHPAAAAAPAPAASSRLTSQNSHRQSLKRVHSEETEDGKRSISVSLPASPSIRRRAVSADPQHEQPESPSKVPLSFESMLKNFEEFAQHQWPTWAKRRGWIADVGPDPATTSAASSSTDDGSGRVVQVDKDKWVFLRNRKKCTPSISLVSSTSIPVETVIEEDILPDLNKAVEKMVDILQIDESRTSTTAVGGSNNNGGSGGQRSRRSSGYASASSSPSAVKRAGEQHHQHQQQQQQSVSTASNSTTTVHLTVAEDNNEDWKISSLYEVTLRWMFDAGSFVSEDIQQSLNDQIENRSIISHINNNQITSNNSVLDDSGTCSLIEDVSAQNRPIESSSDPFVFVQSALMAETIRIYVHFFCRQKNKLPSFIDFRPIPSSSSSSSSSTDDSNVNLGGLVQRQMYTLVFQDGSPALETSFPIEIACIELVQLIVDSHPQLVDWEPRKLAIYEKSWQPGKTSRARLRRLNDFDCPLLLALHWRTSDTSTDTSLINTSNCAKTLILQESQNGDIPWEEFTVAELSSFLKVLDREEKNHEMQIREKYQLLNDRLRETMQLSNTPACNSTSNQSNHLAVSNKC